MSEFCRYYDGNGQSSDLQARYHAPLLSAWKAHILSGNEAIFEAFLVDGAPIAFLLSDVVTVLLSTPENRRRSYELEQEMEEEKKRFVPEKPDWME